MGQASLGAWLPVRRADKEGMPSDILSSCMGVVAPRNPRQSRQVVQHFQETPESIKPYSHRKMGSIPGGQSQGNSELFFLVVVESFGSTGTGVA